MPGAGQYGRRLRHAVIGTLTTPRDWATPALTGHATLPPHTGQAGSLASAPIGDAMEKLVSEADLVKQARAAQSHDGPAASLLAAELRARFPANRVGYLIGAVRARQLRQFDVAQAILDDAGQRFAGQAWLAGELAWLAHARGDADLAQRLAADLRKRFPDSPAGYRIGAVGARGLRQFDLADAILAEAAPRFADEAWLATEQAWLAHMRGDADRALELAGDLRNRFPDLAAGYQIATVVARTQRRFDEASAILAEAAPRFADQAWLASDQAWVVYLCGDAELAGQLAADLRDRFPDHAAGYQIAIILLRASNLLGEAQAILDLAQPRFCDEPWFIRHSAEVSNLAVNRADAARLVTALSREDGDLAALTRARSRVAGKVVVVVGMHRAGTSLCAKIVNRLGFALGGPLLTPNIDNPDGYQEHKDINECHEALLALMGASWDTIWSVRSSVEESLQSVEAGAILDRLTAIVVKELEDSGGCWGFKDPRTACFLPAWINIFDSLGIEPLWVLAVRDPRAVAASLHARNRLPPELGELLWTEHYLNALRHLGSRMACIVHYEQWFSSGREQLATLAGAIGMDSFEAIDHASQAINPELMHNASKTQAAELPVAKAVYTWLCAEHALPGDLEKTAKLVWNHLRDVGKP